MCKCAHTHTHTQTRCKVVWLQMDPLVCGIPDAVADQMVGGICAEDRVGQQAAKSKPQIL